MDCLPILAWCSYGSLGQSGNKHIVNAHDARQKKNQKYLNGTTKCPRSQPGSNETSVISALMLMLRKPHSKPVNIKQKFWSLKYQNTRLVPAKAASGTTQIIEAKFPQWDRKNEPLGIPEWSLIHKFAGPVWYDPTITLPLRAWYQNWSKRVRNRGPKPLIMLNQSPQLGLPFIWLPKDTAAALGVTDSGSLK